MASGRAWGSNSDLSHCRACIPNFHASQPFPPCPKRLPHYHPSFMELMISYNFLTYYLVCILYSPTTIKAPWRKGLYLSSSLLYHIIVAQSNVYWFKKYSCSKKLLKLGKRARTQILTCSKINAYSTWHWRAFSIHFLKPVVPTSQHS